MGIYQDNKDAMEFFRNSKQLESNGKWQEFVEQSELEAAVQEPRNMAQEPRIGFRYGSSSFDAHTKREAAFKAYKDYKKSYYNSRQRNPIITFREFLPIYAKENYADGGRAGYNDGQLVTPNVDGSRPGYDGQKKSEAHKKAMSETKQKKGFERYNTSYDNYGGERTDLKKYTFKEWNNLTRSKKHNVIKKAEMKLEPGAYEGEFAKLTKKQRDARRKNIKVRYHADPTVREKALTSATDYYYKKGGAKARYKADMIKTKGKATLAKEKNRLLKYMEQSAFKWKNPKYKQILDADGFFVGVKDLSHKIDGQYKTYVPFEQYKTRYKNKKNYLPITDHRDYKNFETFFKAAKQFKMEAPDRLLGSYFQKYNRVPSYSEIYNFFERDPRSASRAYQQNSLEIHHRALIANSPTRNLQLTLFDRNTSATGILKGYNNPDNKKLYKNLEAVDKELKKLKVRVKVGNRMLGIGEMLPEESLSDAKKQTVKIFREELKNVGTEKSRWGSRKELFDDMAKKLKLLCPKGQASGGRIGFNVGSGVACGRKQLQKLLFQGGGTKAERSLVQKIISGGGKMALSMLNPKELIRLKNLVGPGALGIYAAFEAGVVTDDVLRMGKPLNESLASNWLFKSFRPHSEEFEKQRNLLQSGKLNDSQRQYALEMMKIEQATKEFDRITMMERTQLTDQGGMGMIDGSPIIPQEEIDTAKQKLMERVDRIKDSAFEEGTGRELENIAAMTEKEATERAKPKSINILGKDIQYSDGFSPLFGKSGTRLVNMVPRPKNIGRGPMTEKSRMKLDYEIPGITPSHKALTPSDDEILNFLKDMGEVHPRFGKLEPGQGTRIRMDVARQQNVVGMHGTQDKFAGGGMVGIRKPNAIPPERQGLRSIMIGDMDD